MEVKDIESLATSFAEKIKEITPQALELAQQMYLLTGFKALVGTVIAAALTYVAYRLARYCQNMHQDYRDSWDVGMVVASVFTGVATFVTCIFFGTAMSNFMNAAFPAAALLKDVLLK